MRRRHPNCEKGSNLTSTAQELQYVCESKVLKKLKSKLFFPAAVFLRPQNFCDFGPWGIVCVLRRSFVVCMLASSMFIVVIIHDSRNLYMLRHNCLDVSFILLFAFLHTDSS